MTNRTYIKLGIVVALVAGFAGLILYEFSGGSEFSSDLGELRSQFNRDKGKSRLLVLLSPT
jgi:hypothetical protein